MAYKLPILAGAGLVVAVLAGRHFLLQPSAKIEHAPTPASAASSQLPAASLVQAAIARIEQHQSITAKMRMRAELLGQTMVGRGEYAQGAAESRQFRVQWNLHVDEQKTSLQQISDGRFLWIQRQLDESAVPIAQVDLDQIPKELGPPGVGGPAGLLAAGGIGRLLQSLNGCFEFTAALPTELGGVPVVAVRGDWNAQALLKLLPDQAEAIQSGQPIKWNKLPPQVPDHVVVFLGRDDLFLYRVEYLRSAPGASADDPGQSLLMVEWFDRKFDQPLPRAEFKFDPGQTSVANETGKFIERLKGWQ